MPNTPLFNFQNPYENNLTLNAYLEIQNKLKELEKNIKSLEYRLNELEQNKNNQAFEYQTSMNMM